MIAPAPDSSTTRETAGGDYGELSLLQRRIADVLDRNSHRLLDLIKDLLDLNRIESGDLPLQLRPTDLGDLFELVQRQVISLAENKNVACTGLGLVIVKHIVEGHGGTIAVASTLGVGTTVTVLIPLSPAVDAPEALSSAGV